MAFPRLDSRAIHPVQRLKFRLLYRLALTAIQKLVEQLMNTGILIAVRVSECRDEDISALFHVRADIRCHRIQVCHDQLEPGPVIADGFLELDKVFLLTSIV